MLKRISPEYVVNMDNVISAHISKSEKDGKWKLYVHVGFQNEKIITDIINFEMQEQALAALNKLAEEKEVYGPIVGSANRLPDNLK